MPLEPECRCHASVLVEVVAVNHLVAVGPSQQCAQSVQRQFVTDEASVRGYRGESLDYGPGLCQIAPAATSDEQLDQDCHGRPERRHVT
jgi:hypothetical protein